MVTAKEIKLMTEARMAGKELGPPEVPSYDTAPGYSTSNVHFSRWSRRSRKRLLPSAISRSGGRLPKLLEDPASDEKSISSGTSRTRGAGLSISIDSSILNRESNLTPATSPIRPAHISPSNSLKRSETGVTDNSSVLDSDILSDEEAMKKFVGDGSRPVPRIIWPKTTDDRLEVMTQIKTGLERLYHHLRPRSLTIKDVLPREYDECNRPILIGVDEDNYIAIQTLFIGLRNIKRVKKAGKKKKRHDQISNPVRLRNDSGKPPLDSEAIESMIEFFDSDQSGEIELIEFMTAFRVANRLFLLGESDGKALTWEKNTKQSNNDQISESEGSVGRLRSTSFEGIDATSDSFECYDDSFSFDGGASLTSTMTGVSFMTATASSKSRIPRCPLSRPELDELGKYATADTSIAQRRRGVFSRVKFEQRLRLLRRAYAAGRAAYKKRWESGDLPEEQPALILNTVKSALFSEEDEAQKQERFEERLEAAALADAERKANRVYGSGIDWAESGFAQGLDPVSTRSSQWTLAKNLRRFEKYLRKVHCQTFLEAVREIPCDILDEVNNQVPFRNLEQFFDSLHGPNPRAVKLFNLKEQKEEAERTERETKERQHAWLKAQEVELELSGVADLIRKLQRHMRLKGLRMFELFTMIDTSGDGLIDRNELRTALLDICRPPPPPESRLATKKREEAMAQEAEEQRRHEQEKAVMLQRMRASEVSGAGEAFAKLDRFMRKYQLTAKTFFTATDKNSDGQLSVDELYAALQKAKCPMNFRQVRKMVAYLDKDGDMTMDEGELHAAIVEYRAFKRAKMFMNQVLERSSSHEQLLPDRMITLLIRYLIDPLECINGGAFKISLDRLQDAVADARIIPLSKMFRQVRRVQNPELFQEMDLDDDYMVEEKRPLRIETEESPMRSPTPVGGLDEKTIKNGIAALQRIGGGAKALFEDNAPTSLMGDKDAEMKRAKNALSLNVR